MKRIAILAIIIILIFVSVTGAAEDSAEDTIRKIDCSFWKEYERIHPDAKLIFTGGYVLGALAATWLSNPRAEGTLSPLGWPKGYSVNATIAALNIFCGVRENANVPLIRAITSIGGQ